MATDLSQATRIVEGFGEGLGLAQICQDTPQVARRKERCAQGESDIDGLLARLTVLWQMREGAERLLEVRHGLPMRRALEGALPGPLPIGQGVGIQAGGGVVLR